MKKSPLFISNWYKSNYYLLSLKNKPKEFNKGSNRVNCGTGWNFYAMYCRSVYHSQVKIMFKPSYFSIFLLLFLVLAYAKGKEAECEANEVFALCSGGNRVQGRARLDANFELIKMLIMLKS